MNNNTGRSYGDFSVGRVLSGTFGVLIKYALPIFVVSFILVGLPTVLIAAWSGSLSSPDSFAHLGILFLSPIVNFLAQTFLILLLTPFCISAFSEEPISMRECFAKTRPFILSALAFSFLSGLGIALGFLIFIIPGCMLMVLWAVGIPAMVTETLDSSSAFERSAWLTNGYGWWVFLVMIIIFLFCLVPATAITIAAGVFEVFSSGDSGSGLRRGWATILTTSALSAVIETINSAIYAASIAALYYELRHIKEGLAPKSIASVFD